MRLLIIFVFQLLFAGPLFSMGADTVAIRLTLASPCEELPSETSLQDTEVTGLSVYPNPGTGMFTIDCMDMEISGNVDLSVHSLHGRLVYAETVDLLSRTHDLDLTAAKPGIYFISLRKEGVILRQKLVIY